MSPLGPFETTGTKCSVTHRHIPEEAIPSPNVKIGGGNACLSQLQRYEDTDSSATEGTQHHCDTARRSGNMAGRRHSVITLPRVGASNHQTAQEGGAL